MSTETKTPPAQKADEVTWTLETMAPEMAKMLPEHIPVERFMRTVRTAINMNPELSKGNRNVFFQELMKCAQDGLLPDGREAVINSYKGKAKYIPMVAGLCKKARNSGEIGTIDAEVVYENDEFDSWIDEKGRHFRHKKARKDRGDPVLTYGYVITKDGAVYYDEMDEEQIKAVENCSTSPDAYSPWKGPFRDEMKRKTVLRRLLKHRVPTSADLDLALRRDDDLYDLNAPKPPAEPGRANRAAAIMGAGEEKKQSPDNRPEPPAPPKDEDLPI